MGDPFEDAARQSLADGSSSMREPSVQQAVTFLNDPRVKGAEPSRALGFLRSKGITENELHEAYRRVGMPFPAGSAPLFTPMQQPFPPGAAPLYPPHAGPAVPYRQPRRGPSWVSVFLGITAAAGIYTAVREVLRRYVVPMYFPDAARIADERRRRDEMSLQEQELQIVELRERIQELVESTKKTSEKVENLSDSITSSLAVRERELSQNSELRNAIRQLSHSVTASGGTDTSQAVKDGPSENASDAGYLHYMNGNHAQKHGSLAYSHVDNFNSIAPGAEESQPRFSETPLANLNGETQGSATGRSSTNVRTEKAGKHPASDDVQKPGAKGEHDDFMAIAPAEVEDSWRTGLTKQEDADAGTEQDKSVWESAKGYAQEKEDPSDEVEAIVGNSGLGEEVSDEVEALQEDLMDYPETSTTRTARQLFQTELMKEAKHVLGGIASTSETSNDASKGRARPLSMPQMDVPLSDDD